MVSETTQQAGTVCTSTRGTNGAAGRVADSAMIPGLVTADSQVSETIEPLGEGIERVPVISFGTGTGFSVQTFVCGYVRISPNLAWGGADCSIIKGSGFFARDSDRVWLPVCSFLVTTPHGRLLVDTAWNRNMSPFGVYDRRAQIDSLGSWPLYRINQGEVGPTAPSASVSRRKVFSLPISTTLSSPISTAIRPMVCR